MIQLNATKKIRCTMDYWNPFPKMKAMTGAAPFSWDADEI